MSDIVERLRGKHLFFSQDGGSHWLMGSMADPDCIAGAAEIERLQGMVASVQWACQAEIERLQMELNACGLDCEAYFNCSEELAAEVGRLQGIIEFMTAANREAAK